MTIGGVLGVSAVSGPGSTGGGDDDDSFDVHARNAAKARTPNPAGIDRSVRTAASVADAGPLGRRWLPGFIARRATSVTRGNSSRALERDGCDAWAGRIVVFSRLRRRHSP